MMTFGVQFAESFPTTLRYYCSLHRYETSPNCLIEWIERIEWVSEWVNEWASEQASDRTNEQTKERTNERMLFVWQCEHLSDMWLSTLEFGSAQLRYVTEIAPKSPFLCENRSPSRYGRTDGRTNERTNAFRVAVWTPIRYVTLYCRARHGAASLHYRNHRSYGRTEGLSGMVFMPAQKLSGILRVNMALG